MNRAPSALSLDMTFSIAFLCTMALIISVQGVVMDPTQVAALLESKQDLGQDPGIAASWTQTNLQGSCNTPNLAFGIASCNATGFVTVIDIAYLQGDLTPPSAWSKLVALQRIRLDAGLTGSLPASWSSLTNLETLSIAPYSASQKLMGGFPASWSALTSLKSLTLVFGSITFVRNPPPPTAPPTWLSQIPVVSITNADWTNNELPTAWGASSSQMSDLTLSNCLFSGGFPFLSNQRINTVLIETVAPGKFGTGITMPSDFSGMTNLTSISFAGGYFTGSLPSKLPPSIRTAHFSYLYQLTGSIPQSLVDTPGLKDLYLAFLPGVTGAIPGPSTGAASTLQYYALIRVGITGSISPNVFATSSLIGIDFEILDTMTGSLPLPAENPTAGNECKLTSLVIANSALGGSLPAALFSRCSQLAYIAIFGNKLTGQLPDLLLPTRVSTLTLSNNNFGGTIPTINFTITGISPIGTFACSGCQLTGTVPPSLVTNNLVSLDLSYNKLDLCSNAAAIQETGFTNRSSTSFVCSLVGQTPRECGCPTLWQSTCFPKRPMAPDCAMLPPDTLPPPPTPFSTQPTLSANDEPTNSATKVTSISLVTLMCLATIIGTVMF